ncbi:hypothetical protein N473_08710 [Pseudoalteromonas luteoviolacea CPMOR-1]|uniref:NADAR domain-containing protein n=1 Tax=Pseudoalteromonas luteoviolacea CPMOR-1 TaxID=1365248 RepID=A0A162CE40_9GAMM|nr:NADAR family protein [Pseudoalteromonas luteoviolacea]KZN66462.1 hypothetical protein N473_08710 [Pseudoalteromonas luteoviolacea CPMOR-1]
MKIRTREELVDHLKAGNQVKHLFFWGHQERSGHVTKSCFSQWYESKFEENGYLFATAEHYMMYHKAKLFDDNEACERVLSAKTPGAAKAIGREVRGFEQKVWESKRFGIVVNANLAKFSQNPALKAFLINTRDRILVEASPVDKIWGVGLAQDDPRIEDVYSWQGLNLLGFALMEVREKLINCTDEELNP